MEKYNFKGKFRGNMLRISELNIFENFTIFEISKLVNTGVIQINSSYWDLRTDKIDETKVLNFLVDSLKQFTLIFNEYLVLIVDKFLEDKQFKYSTIKFPNQYSQSILNNKWKNPS